VPKSSCPADRPGHRRAVERQLLLDLVEDLERDRGLAVHLVDEGDDRDVAQRQTSNSFSVLGSMPLAASITMTAASTAVSVR
jgi:hypothetical protein